MWTANLFQVATGAIGPRVNFENASWSISINEIESLSLDLTKADLPDVDLDLWLAPWWAGILLKWNNKPIFGGPIISLPTESFKTIRLDCKGIRAVLEHRFVIREMSDWALLSRDKLTLTGTYSSIAKQALEFAQAKPGGRLPISFPLPADPTAVTHSLTFSGYDLNNISAHTVLSQISNFTNGPDFMFRPREIDGNSLTFDFWHGSETSPYLPQKATPIWDTTPIKGEVTDLDIVTTGTHQVNRVFGTGPGTNESTLIKLATDTTPLIKGFPLLESVVSTGVDASSGSNANVLTQNRTNAALAANTKKLQEIQLTVRADGEHQLGAFWPGEQVQLVMQGWRALPDGTHNLRLLNINGSQDGNVRMSLQLER